MSDRIPDSSDDEFDDKIEGDGFDDDEDDDDKEGETCLFKTDYKWHIAPLSFIIIHIYIWFRLSYSSLFQVQDINIYLYI